ncbi:hypothetical protein F383_32680 [Gossypium arboreum]|uniref:Uncharacterized protein n=1 Tax=Gossypium arboreum TaxID=29729 RepID=A0A0B0MZX1_GOSAR|nr:hypothetical protein F383_32680 [Gossypium arboreum]
MLNPLYNGYQFRLNPNHNACSRGIISGLVIWAKSFI